MTTPPPFAAALLTTRARPCKPADTANPKHHLKMLMQAVSRSTMFVGTSPEFELALYTLCFFCGHEENRVRCGPYDLTVKCHRMYGNDNRVGTCFPVADE
jgi:Endoribonuclease XendoU